MLSFGSSTTIEVETTAPTTERWSRMTRVAFRFCFVYFGLYALTTQMLGGFIPSSDMPSLEELPPFKNLVTWTAVHVFGITRPLVITGSGSGDKTFNWIAALCLLVIATAATVGWSVLDRERTQYVTLNKWFRLFLRFATGSTMLVYGMVKAIPLQMPAPSLTRLVEPFGYFSPMGVLWASIGASSAYERFAGVAELSAAVCLFIPRLSLVGALILLADSIQIFVLNMTYDVPVKLFSFHLILMALLLIAPEARRIANVLIFNRTAEPWAGWHGWPSWVVTARVEQVFRAGKLRGWHFRPVLATESDLYADYAASWRTLRDIVRGTAKSRFEGGRW